jgi:uncharacterized RDD family membrane protein YckC
VNLRLAAEIASQAAAGPALPDLATASDAGPAWPPGTPGGGVPGQLPAQTPGADLQALVANPAAGGSLAVSHGSDRLGLPEDWFESSAPAKVTSGVEVTEPAEAAPSAVPSRPILADDMILALQKDFITPSAAFAKFIHGDLKANPWLEQAVNTAAMEPERQSSGIDRTVMESLPAQFLMAEAAAAAVVARTAPEWPHPGWPGLNLEDQRMREIPLLIAPPAVKLQPALLRVRFKAVVVDGALTLGAVLAATLAATLNLEGLPGMKAMALGVAAAAVLFAALYQILFLTLSKATPGMKAAHLVLRTLEDEEPTRAQRCGRLGALLLSLLPAGLGVLWAFFDRDRLSLHDWLSGTYLRKY